jgi:DNA repair protein RecO (recombination protein O)
VNKKTTKAIVLKRVDYADSDRIITILTPDDGKFSLIAKGVKKLKSKLAGGIELFSVLDAGYINGRGELGRLTSARLDEYYSNIINDINRVQLGYQILKAFENIEDQAESVYFYLLCQLLRLLNESVIPLTKIELYYKSKMLALAGHTPNLQTDEDNNILLEDKKYNFNVLTMSLSVSPSGRLTSNHIKILRLLFDQSTSDAVFRIKIDGNEDEDIIPLIDAMFMAYVSI